MTSVRRPRGGPATPPEAIEVGGLFAGYGSRPVLHDLSLALRFGAITAMVGPGGSGKSTLARALSGAGPAGFWWSGGLRTEHVRRLALPQGWSDAQAVVAALVTPGGDEARARRRSAAVWGRNSALAGALREALPRAASAVPVWLRRLASLTRILVEKADLLVIDEPDAELPSEMIPGLAAGLRARTAATVLVVTHHLSLARAVADDVVLMVDGEILERGAVRDFFERPLHARSRDFVRFGS